MPTSADNPTTIAQIEAACRSLDTETCTLEAMSADLAEQIQAAVAPIRARLLPALKRQAAVVARRKGEVLALGEQAEEIFVKPRTMVFHGTKVGFVKSPGKLETDDVEFVVAQIRKHFPDQFDELVRSEHALNKDALKRMPAKDLAKLGCSIEGAGDQFVCTRVGGEIEKLVDNMLSTLVEQMVNPSEV